MDDRHYGPWAFIAGGSEGVGASFALKLAARGLNLVLTARKPEPLDEVAHQVRKQSDVKVRTLSLDLTAADMLDRIKAVTADIEVGMLIYNAGADSIIREFHERSLADAERMLALNVTGPTRLAHHFGAGMRQRKRGGIILVGSLAAYAGNPRTATYAGVKAFQVIFAEGLWYELRPHNVHVLALVLSVTRTPAVTRMGLKFDIPGFEAAEPDSVAQEGLDHLGVEPVWHAAGNAALALKLRSMPRVEAIALTAQANQSLSS
jgi:short-subunit dehydrogenase